MLYYNYFYAELLALASCMYAYRKLDSNFKIFLPFLAFVVIYEFANIYNLLLWHHTNVWSVNFEEIVELAVYGRFMASLDKRKTYRNKVYITIAAGIIISLIDVFFIQGFWSLGTIAIVLKNTILAVLVCIYYYNLLNNADDYPDLLGFPPFLATMGLLLYSLANFFYFAFFDYLVRKNNYVFLKLAQVIPQIGCILIYLLLSISFLCFLRTKKLS
ncbi:MAG: hypothetical protein JWQ34_1666 [Mucilaginibacter sp.]|uniref:hypothetical protein n=1 Tax=Mucilaginibacter sp. TaxID=1882438 RepID=UPI0026135DE9|nr:hypothetical protein [Mucilaginibacter sp.]MDB5003441.1 hypothetical protein [Mucilaginibacter sp.]